MAFADFNKMPDEEFLSEFEAAILPASEFHHREHVRVVWLYLHRYSVLETLNRFSAGLRRFAAANGKSGRYHETITWAYVLLINERIERGSSTRTWSEFVNQNEDLCDWQDNILRYYYREETLDSDLARRVFLLPDCLKTSSQSFAPPHRRE